MTWTIPASRSLRTGGPGGGGRRPGGRRVRPRLESLESRALLSGVEARISGPTDASALVTRLYEGLLHRAPDPAGETYWSRQLDAGRPPARVAQRFLVSREYAASHPTAQSFVEGLYNDVLGHAPDPAGEAFWVGALGRRAIGRARLASLFLGEPGSIVSGGPGSTLGGFVTGVSVNKSGWASGTSLNKATVAGTYNNGDFSPALITISVNGPGQYVLDQGQSGFVGNNTGSTWTRYTLAIQSTSTAGATFVSSSDLSGRFPSPTVTAKTITYSGGSVPSGPSSWTQPYTTINTTAGGTIVIQETPA